MARPAVSTANRKEDRKSERGIEANETDDDDFDNAHDLLSCFPFRSLPTADEQTLEEGLISRCDGHHRQAQFVNKKADFCAEIGFFLCFSVL
ncbi:hypothetical protein [Hyphococcus sp. DH-69]|uniref:hypothetical protein n=1 Tax=Hyphococcus formosus TaxID=3143534 RepID=UPI00398A98EB